MAEERNNKEYNLYFIGSSGGSFKDSGPYFTEKIKEITQKEDLDVVFSSEDFKPLQEYCKENGIDNRNIPQSALDTYIYISNYHKSHPEKKSLALLIEKQESQKLYEFFEDTELNIKFTY